MNYQLNTNFTFLFLILTTAIFANPSITSEGQELQINAATICEGASVSMQVPSTSIPDNYVWLKNNIAVGIGASLTIESFSTESAGEYRLIETFQDGTFDETIFVLHFLDLGEDLIACEAQTIEFVLAEGPSYQWSNGSESNSFTVSFEESETISVTAITEFGCTTTDEYSITILDIQSDISVNPIEENCCQASLDINISADELAFPAFLYADYKGQQTLLVQLNSAGTESIVKDMGAYSNVYVQAASGCILEMEDFTIENQGPFFDRPYMRSMNQQKGLREATICEAGSVILFMPENSIPQEFIWMKGNEFLGLGYSIEITDFNNEKAGIYTCIEAIPGGGEIETNFVLNYLSLGEDLEHCGNYTYEEELPYGPSYTWNDESEGNSYSQEILGLTTISVSAITEFGCVATDEKILDVTPMSTSISINPIEDNCCQSLIDLSVMANEEAFPITVYADFEGQQTLLAQFNSSSTESFVKNMGTYSNVFAEAVNGCVLGMDDFTIENQGPFFDRPFMRSRNQQKGLQEATICQGGTVSLFMPDISIPQEFIWMKGEEFLGLGYSVEISDFNQEKAGIYTCIESIPGGGTSETIFKLNYLSLGEDLVACIDYQYDVELPFGPAYTWSDGSEGNTFSQLYSEPTTISVSSITEFGCAATSQKIIHINPLSANLELIPIEGNCCQSLIAFNASANEDAFPVQLFATVGGEEQLLATLSSNGTEEFVADAGDYTNIYISASNDCVLELPSIKVETQGQSFSGPYMRSRNIEKEITEATICAGGTVTMLVPEDGLAEDHTWYKNNVELGTGFSLSINDFDQEKSGTYRMVKELEEGAYTEVYYTVHFLNLGDDFQACGEQLIEFNLPEGPEYSWSTGDTGNYFIGTFEDKTTISVSAITEFDCIVTDNLVAHITPMAGIIFADPIPGNCCEGQVYTTINSPADIFPIKVYASKQGEESIIAEFFESGTQTFTLLSGEYTNIYASATNGCILELPDVVILLQGPDMVDPYMVSNNMELGIQEATICMGATVSMNVPQESMPENYSWFRNGQIIGTGFSFTVENFDQEKAGSYVSQKIGEDGFIQEFEFTLNYLTLGEDIESCSSVELNYNLPKGPNYSWSTGDSGNEVSLNINESTNVQIYAITEFGCIVTDERQITVSPFVVGAEIITEASDCELAAVEFSVESNDPSVYPVQISATMDGEEYLLATVFGESQLVSLDPGMYVFVSAVSNKGCELMVPGFELQNLSSDADISVKNPTNPCSDGKIIITTDEDQEEAFPMRLTAYHEPTNDWIEIGILTEQNQTFVGEVGNYLDVELKNQFGCIVSFAPFTIEEHEIPCGGEQKPDGSIADFVFYDKNENGIYDNGDFGVADVRVSAINREGEIVKSAMTKPDGKFLIDEIELGDYYLHFDLPGQLGFTTPNVGDDDSMDSDVDHSNGPATTPFLDISNRAGGTGFTAGVGAFVLPVTWTSISAENRGDYNTVSWSTASEDDVQHFVIQRSLETADSFQDVERITPLGSVYEGSRYSFDDYNFGLARTVYYRIKSVDLDGTISMTDIVVVNIESNERKVSFAVYPNPTADYIYINIDGSTEDSEAVTTIYNEVGEKLLVQENVMISNQSVRLDLSTLPTGSYLVQTMISGKRFTEKIVVVK